MKNILLLFIFLAIVILQCSCSQQKKNIEAVRLENIRNFEDSYSRAKTNILDEMCLANAERLGNTLEKLKGFKLCGFKEAIITSAILYKSLDRDMYVLTMDRIDPYFRVYEIEMNNEEKTFLIENVKFPLFDPEREKQLLKYYDKVYHFVRIAYPNMQFWTPNDKEYTEIKNSNKKNWRVRFLKSGVPATEWHPVTFYDFESKEYQKSLEELKQSINTKHADVVSESTK